MDARESYMVKWGLALALLLGSAPSSGVDCQQLFQQASPDNLSGYTYALHELNQINPNVHTVVVVNDTSSGAPVYTVIAGADKPIYRGSDVSELANQIDASASQSGAHAVYVSLAGFMPHKAAAMRTNIALQWKVIKGKGELVVRAAPSAIHADDVPLPDSFYLKADHFTQESLTTGGIANKGGGVTMLLTFDKPTSPTSLMIKFAAATQRIARMLEQVIRMLLPSWQSRHLSSAEIVAETLAEMRKRNPSLRLDDIRIEIQQQFGQSVFVLLDLTIGTGVRGLIGRRG